MKFLDKDGREMTNDEVRGIGCGYLLDEAPYSICDRCCRKVYSVEKVQCLMTQPDGKLCPGQLYPVTTFINHEGN